MLQNARFTTLFCLFWSYVSSCFNLPFEIYAYEVVIFDFELAFDGIDKKRKLAATLRVLLRGTLNLAERQLHAHLRRYLTGFPQAAVMRLLDHAWPMPTASPHPPRCGMAPCCRGS